MSIAYLAVTLLTAVAMSYAAYLNFVGHESVIAVADRVGAPRSWMVPFGVLFAAAVLGLLAGLVLPVLGTAAASGLVLYFLGAVGAHLRVRDYKGMGNAVAFLVLAVAALAVALAHRGPW